jgi:diguanylate cyclase (GGDEF)-like protein
MSMDQVDNTLRRQRMHRMVNGIGAAYLVLAWLSSRAGEYLPAVQLLYALPLVYSMLRLNRIQLAGLAAFALITHGVALFMLVEGDHRLNQPATWSQFAALAVAFAWCGYSAGAVLRLRERLAEVRRRLHDIGQEADDRASRDSLTGAYHQHHLMEVLEREIARAERVGKPLSIARVDLDGLGIVNASHGQSTGDIALKRFTDAAATALRNVDIFGRYGGKEFLAIMPDTDLQGALVAAERIRAAVGHEPLPETQGRRHQSCTLGVAEHRKGENTRLLIGRAESALNYAKAAGRDRVVALDANGKPMLTGAA